MNEKPVNKIDKKKTIKRAILSFLLIALIMGIIALVFKLLGVFDLTREQLQEKIARAGALGPLIFILLSFLQVTFIPLPSVVTILAGNYVFGFFMSYIYSLIGIMLGSIFAFFLGKKIGRPFVNWIFNDKETVDYYLNNLKGKEIVVLFFMFLLPFFPDDALCSIAGIMPISYPLFIAMQLITRSISILATLLFMSGDIIPYHGWGLVILIIIGIASIILFIIAYKNSEKINNALLKFSDRFIKKKKQN